MVVRVWAFILPEEVFGVLYYLKKTSRTIDFIIYLCISLNLFIIKKC